MEGQPPQIHCLKDKGCASLIEAVEEMHAIAGRVDVFVATLTQSFAEHSKTSDEFWRNTKEQISETLLELRECTAEAHRVALTLQSGDNRMTKIEESVTTGLNSVRREIDNHISGKDTISGHVYLNRCMKLIVSVELLILIFLTFEHHEFIGFCLRWIAGLVGIKL